MKKLKKKTFIFGGIIAVAFGVGAFIGQGEPFLVMIVPMLIMVVSIIPISAIVGLSVYTGFRDIFYKTV